MRRRVGSLLVCAAVLLAAAAPASAQQFTGGVRGTVRDAQGVIVGATVTLTNAGTNDRRSTRTNEVGEYSLFAVPPATYTIRASRQGYQRYEQHGIRIGTQEFVTLDLTLEVGVLTQTVTVTADAPLLETSNASIGATLDREMLDTLPAPGRNAFLIAVTVPTMHPAGDPQFNRQQDQTNASRISLGGGSVRDISYLLDGVPITELRGRPVVIPSIEALADIRVQVHTYDAELGRSGGGVFNTTARSGTNTFHGSGFFQTRPVWGLARNYFNLQQGLSKEETGLADTYYRLYGGGSGGPTVRDRTFFWTAVEGYRSRTTRNLQQLWPSARQRVGDFSRTTVDGRPVRIFNPYCRGGDVNARCPATGPSGTLANPEFVNGRIPGFALSPSALRMAATWPLPPEANEDTTPNARVTANIVDEADMWTLKVEHKLRDDWSLSGLYLYNNTDEPGSVAMPKGFEFLDRQSNVLRRRSHVLVLNTTSVLNDTTVLTARYGWTTWADGSDCGQPNGCFAPGLASLGVNRTFIDAVDSTGQNLFPSLNFEEFTNVGVNLGTSPLRWDSPYAVNATLSTLVGSHTLRFGGDFRRIGSSGPISSAMAGTFAFQDDFTHGPSGEGGYDFASFLVGAPSSGSVPFNRGDFDVRTTYSGGFFQDDWRVSSRFTINYGVRFEHEAGLREADNRFTVGFDENAVSPLDALVPASARAGTPLENRVLLGGLIFAGVDGAPTHQGNPPGVMLAPRVGATWALDDRTVVRGGYGLFFRPWQYHQTQHGQTGFNRITTMNQSSDEREVPLTTLEDVFSSGLPDYRFLLAARWAY